ncbi:MAG TPA: amidohydrolase family protein, partial [Vicinamibacterales bacterium]
PRFKKAGAVASPAPAVDSPADAWLRLVGGDRAAEVLPIGELLAAKARVIFGSRWPDGSLNPMETIHAFVNRGTDDDGGDVAPSPIPLERVIDGMTSSAAYASYDEQRKGTLKAGMLADLVVLSNDIFSAPASRLRGAQVAVTIFDGRVVYRKGPKTTN